MKLGRFTVLEIPQAVPARPSGEGRLEQYKVLESEEGKMMGSGLQGVSNGEKKLSIWLGFCFSRSVLGKILIKKGRPCFYEDFEVIFREGSV
jgi:hypothetical protein